VPQLRRSTFFPCKVSALADRFRRIELPLPVTEQKMHRTILIEFYQRSSCRQTAFRNAGAGKRNAGKRNLPLLFMERLSTRLTTESLAMARSASQTGSPD